MNDKANEPEELQSPEYYVAIGASAGGLQAIEAFFAALPPGTTFAYVIIQHLSPDYKSLMVEILSKKTPLPVHRAVDGTRVERGHVYLIPPKKNLTISNGKLCLSEQDHSSGLNLPIDVFLRSLAQDQGEKAIAIILSGTGSDGMRGVRAVKQFGGMIMVQDDETAKFDGMPRAAISTGLADFILPPEQMPRQLVAFTQHPQTIEAPRSDALLGEEDELTHIFALLRKAYNVDFTYYKPATVTRRIQRRMTVNRIDDLEGYVQFVLANRGELYALFRELLVGVTSFFRDPAVFERLRTDILPGILSAASGPEVRLWVAGCSTGEEAYTLAMLANECAQEPARSREIKIFATDIDKDALQFAAVGSYPESIAADVPLPYLSKYFYRKEEHFQIVRSIREMVVFAQHNVAKDPPFTNIQLLSCRNLLIYLQPILQKKALELFSFSLNSGGVLLLGSSETVGEMDGYYETLDSKLRIYRSKRQARHFAVTTPAQPATDTRARELHGHYANMRRDERNVEDSILERFLDAASKDILPTAAIVDDQLELLHIIGNSEGYFRLPVGRPTLEIDKVAVRELAIPLSTGVQKVFRERREIRLSGVPIEGDKGRRTVDLRILPMPERRGQQPLAAVLIREREESQDEDSANAHYDLSKEAEQRIHDLEQELQFSRENLQATIEELETANEELQATNEELLASNEELQSTNEELQSTNEELYTVNTEYHTKITELTELNNDVDNLLNASQIGQLMLTEDLEVRRFSPRVAEIFRLGKSDVGRPLPHVTHTLRNFDPIAAMRGVLAAREPDEWEVQTEDGTWYLLRIVPYAVGPDSSSGLVASFVDITDVKRAQEDLRESQETLAIVANASPALVWMSGTDKLCNWFNDPWLQFTGKTMEEELGHGWTRGVHPEDLDECVTTYSKAFDKREPFSMEYRLRRHDGEYRWILDEGQPRFSSDGEFKGYIGSCLDVTELKKAEDEGRVNAQ